MNAETLELAKQLINIESITPNDNGCQDLIEKFLIELGFTVKKIPSNGVSNLWAEYGKNGPLFAFSGHTDVVPPGNINKWQSSPFEATIKEGYLFGRGAADMKSALAAMLVACKIFLKKNPNFNGKIGFLITSDEEGNATDGTKKIVDYLQENNIKLNWCLIGEASSQEKLGDSIKVGRRGSLHGELQVFGKQGHIAYPQLADNPIHRSFKALDALTQTIWDHGDDVFTPTSFQIYNINADTGASNVIPGILTARFNFRFAPTSTADSLKNKVHKVFDDHNLQYDIQWNLMSQPFLSSPGQLTQAVKDSVREICGIETHPNTTGGTSDGRFIAATGCEIVELGAISKCIHQVNEHIKVADLEKLTELYERTLTKIFA
jgi:succinyl-diaminopimelate desuccinylase